MFKIKEISNDEKNLEFEKAFNDIKKEEKVICTGYLPKSKRIKLDVYLSRNRIKFTEWLEEQVDKIEDFKYDSTNFD